jgi:GR25 family glycosyltransferase involved in LPS biosynthesis
MFDTWLNRNCGQGKWKAYCISLKRCTERRNNFTVWANDVGLTFDFFDAIDKKNLTQDILDSNGIIVGKEISSGATACRFSHEALYDLALKDGAEYIFILEDDAGFVHSTKEDLEEFLKALEKSKSKLRPSMIQFGFHTATKTQYNLFYKSISDLIYKYDYADQTHAILYTSKTISMLYDLCKNKKHIRKPIDAIINVFQINNMGLCLGPSSSLIEQVDSVSYIWN